MSRQRTPLAKAELTGAIEHNPKRFADRVEPTPRGPLGDPPLYFNVLQQQYWRDLVARVPEGVLTAGDTFLVELTVLLIEKLREGEIKPVEIGHLRACLGSMGLTPADRTRVNGSNEPPQEADPLDIILGANGTGKAN